MTTRGRTLCLCPWRGPSTAAPALIIVSPVQLTNPFLKPTSLAKHAVAAFRVHRPRARSGDPLGSRQGMIVALIPNSALDSQPSLQSAQLLCLLSFNFQCPHPLNQIFDDLRRVPLMSAIKRWLAQMAIPPTMCSNAIAIVALLDAP